VCVGGGGNETTDFRERVFIFQFKFNTFKHWSLSKISNSDHTTLFTYISKVTLIDFILIHNLNNLNNTYKYNQAFKDTFFSFSPVGLNGGINTTKHMLHNWPITWPHEVFLRCVHLNRKSKEKTVEGETTQIRKFWWMFTQSVLNF
jgi:hypothetical protein